MNIKKRHLVLIYTCLIIKLLIAFNIVTNAQSSAEIDLSTGTSVIEYVLTPTKLNDEISKDKAIWKGINTVVKAIPAKTNWIVTFNTGVETKFHVMYTSKKYSYTYDGNTFESTNIAAIRSSIASTMFFRVTGKKNI